VLVCGDEISRGKPDPECFLQAAERLRAEPASCTVIEDAPAGIQAAQAAGMSTIAITTTHDASELAAADETFASLRDAAPRLLTRAAEPS
jgi:sugar-phosphatase